MNYIIILVILVIAILIYFKIAARLNIIDKPNNRSSHSNITVSGGAIIIPLAFFCSWLLGLTSWDLAITITIVSIVSFIDDIVGLHQIPRLTAHLFATVLIFWITGLTDYNWYVLIVVGIIFIGWINAFNFMDGINGIMVLYGLVNLGSFYYLSSNDNSKGVLVILILSSLVFAFFNVRKKAKSFAGDVGSISLAFILGYYMLDLVLQSSRWEYVMFFSVFGIDSVITILFRLKNKENIFKAHRSHLYQYFANDLNIPHIKISFIYAIIQLIINIIVMLGIEYECFNSVSAVVLLLVLSVVYFIIRAKVVSLISAKVRASNK